MADKYEIRIMYFKGGSRRIRVVDSLEEAQKICSDPETSSRTCKRARNKRRTEICGPWFYGYERI